VTCYSRNLVKRLFPKSSSRTSKASRPSVLVITIYREIVCLTSSAKRILKPFGKQKNTYHRSFRIVDAISAKIETKQYDDQFRGRKERRATGFTSRMIYKVTKIISFLHQLFCCRLAASRARLSSCSRRTYCVVFASVTGQKRSIRE